MINAAYCLCLDRRWQEDSGPVVKLQNDVHKYLGLELNLFWAGDGYIIEIDYDHIDIPKEQCAKYLTKPAEHSMKGHANAFLCHKKMFNRALKDLHDPEQKVLFLEDDAYFIENRCQLLPWVLRNDFDVLYIGWQGREYPDDSDDMNEVEQKWATDKSWCIQECTKEGPKISGLHGVIMNGYAIAHLAELNKGPVDSYINEHMLDMEVYYIRPKIIGSRASYSYCENKWQPRSELK